MERGWEWVGRGKGEGVDEGEGVRPPEQPCRRAIERGAVWAFSRRCDDSIVIQYHLKNEEKRDEKRRKARRPV